MASEITQERLKELLQYNPEMGLFTWIKPTSNRVKPGFLAGSLLKCGHMQIRLDGKFYKSHRLAWLYMTGRWPDADIDHINGKRHDNRWSNLREATRAQNAANRAARAGSRCGFKGVRLHKRGKYQARITVNYKEVHLGYFDTAEDAHAAYCVAAERHFGNFARTA